VEEVGKAKKKGKMNALLFYVMIKDANNGSD